MKKFLTLFLLFVVATAGFSQDRVKRNMSPIMETGSGISNYIVKYGNPINRGAYPNGVVIPNADNFFDYVTNGKNASNMWAFGDTMIVSYFGADSVDPTGANSRVSYYIISYDKGNTWLPAPISLTSLPRRSAYPDAVPYIGGIGRNVGLSGRLYTSPGPGSTGGGAYTDAILGLGSITSVQTPNSNRDYFSDLMSGTIMGGIAGIAGSAGSDTLNFWAFDMSSNTFTTVTPVVLPNNGIEENARWHFFSNGNNDGVAVWWDSPAGMEALRYSRTTDGGATWSAHAPIQVAFSTNGVINGDTCSPWFGIDGAYEPGTSNYYVAWSTLFPTGTGQTSGDPQGCKILFWGPNVNGGVPVEVAGRSNMNTIADTNLLFPVLGLTGGLQVGVTPVSHPSIGFGANGRIVCTFSGYQPLPDTLDGFAMNDIYACYSDDGGATWTAPENLTNTADWDELYPTVSPQGNTNEFFIHYQATRGPGCQSFSDLAPTYRVHEIFDIYVTPTSISNISSEIPDGFKLGQNYPNPFNPSTKIQFSVPKASQVSLRVYNAAGMEVANLINNQQINAGTFEYTFDGAELSSGVYFYTLSAGDFKETKKMLLVK